MTVRAKEASDRFTVGDAAEIYGISNWGRGYLTIADDGHLRVSPIAGSSQGIDLPDVMQDLARRGIRAPVLLRFPQLLARQVDALTGAFRRSIEEYGYPGSYRPVFPLKVNHRRSVVEQLASAGWSENLGVEVGSRAELLAAMALDLPPDALLICNGYKDREYLATAVLATRLGRRVVVVIEKPFELDAYLALGVDRASLPGVGVRCKLQARGSGLWEKSGGFASKFGLSTMQLLHAVERLESAGLVDKIQLLHFHIGSQITEIRKVKIAIREAARVYAKLHKAGTAIRFLDVGGGLGVDYDGSRTSSDASVNYTVQEYANDVVFGIQEVCDEEHVPPPTIVSESGRHLTAYHGILVADVRDVIVANGAEPPAPRGGAPQVVHDLAEIAATMGVKNYRELYHDALEYRDNLNSMFNLGMIELVDRATGEALFWKIAQDAVRWSRTGKFQGDEFEDLENKLTDKYILNMSVFQSLPDHWALDQLFPIVPIHRLDERPTRTATLVDITCDSDGEVDRFVDLKDIKESLELHEPRPGEPYYLGFLLIGAYQDTMGDVHNLFARVHEAEVLLAPDGRTVVRNVRRGDTAGHTLRQFGYERDDLVSAIRRLARERASRADGGTDPEALVADYTRGLDSYPYLSD